MSGIDIVFVLERKYNLSVQIGKEDYMKKIRFAICGAGHRAIFLAKNAIPKATGTEIVAGCDPYEDKAEGLCSEVEQSTGLRPRKYTDHIEMFEKEKPDAVLVATGWKQHIDVAIDALERGIAVAMEVGGAYGEEECRKLIEVQERTKTPFMFMENCCFGREELLALSLARRGVFGRVVYCHGAYRHDLREEIATGNIKRHYRLEEYSTRNRDNYPTHELGPIAKILGINRGNRMVSLVSRASGAFGLSEYVKDKPELSELHNRKFAQGDIVETLITCENGEMISLKLDTTLPAHYSRELTVRGTRGMYNMDANMVVEDGKCEEIFYPFDFIKKYINNAEEYYNKYLPEIWKGKNPTELEEGHGGIDFFEFETFCECLRTGCEMPIDVYDAAAWMSIAYLSEQSIAKGGAAVEIPDFTNGAYKTRKPIDVVKL